MRDVITGILERNVETGWLRGVLMTQADKKKVGAGLGPIAGVSKDK